MWEKMLKEKLRFIDLAGTTYKPEFRRQPPSQRTRAAPATEAVPAGYCMLTTTSVGPGTQGWREQARLQSMGYKL